MWTVEHWIGFTVGVCILLVLDLTVFHRNQETPSLRSSLAWTGFWCLLALAFNYYIYLVAGKKPAVEFISGYLVEWSLSVDNVFVFAVVFRFFKIPLKYQHRVLFWGILGAIVMRFIFILVGTELLKHFEWIMVIFGLLLVVSGIKMLKHDSDEVDPNQNILMRWARKVLPVHPVASVEKFFIKENGKWYVTSLFLVLLVLESTDVLFAVDSVPAIFGITREPFIVYTSNIAAILGLRSLYFLLAGVVNMFKYLNYGLAGILIFVGVKMNAEFWLNKFGAQSGESHHLISPEYSLLTIVAILGVSIVASLLVKNKDEPTTNT